MPEQKLTEILRLPALQAAPLLLGCELSRLTPNGEIRLKIVETEAYKQDDPASHSFRGLTPRNAPMFEDGGTIYVYFTYGMHYAVNIVTGDKGAGEAVLLRAGEPLEGTALMKNNRGQEEMDSLANGPGKLAQALGISDTDFSGEKLSKNSLQLFLPKIVVRSSDIAVSSRIGIRLAVESPLRFYIKDNPYVSRYTAIKGDVL